MRDISRTVLARDAAARLDRASCRGKRELWDRHERAFADAETRGAEVQAAEGALALCDDCPVFHDCDTWARIDRYTGLAAGRAWRNGRPRMLDRPLQQLAGWRTGVA